MKTKIANIIKKSKKIAITSHIRPDADCIGSGLALYLMLKQLGKEVYFCNTEKAPFPLTKLPCFDVIEFRQVYPESFDLFMLIEGETEARTGQKHIDKYHTVNIDHHRTNLRHANLNWVVPEASAVGELIYELGVELNIEFTRDIEYNLYAAISSDTGSFKYSNTTFKSLYIASELVKKNNFDPSDVSDLLFNSNYYEKIQMMQKVLSTLELHIDKKVSIIEFKKEFLRILDLKDIETEDIVSIARSIIGVEVTIFFKEIGDDYYRVSVRSRKEFNSQLLAKKFNGGGHECAAGFFYKGSIEKAKQEVVNIIEKHLK